MQITKEILKKFPFVYLIKQIFDHLTYVYNMYITATFKLHTDSYYGYIRISNVIMIKIFKIIQELSRQLYIYKKKKNECFKIIKIKLFILYFKPTKINEKKVN